MVGNLQNISWKIF